MAGAAAVVILCSGAGCGDRPDPSPPPCLICPAGAQGPGLSVEEFRQAFEVARMAYDPALIANLDLERQAKARLLEELVREAVIVERGKALGLVVEQAELQAAIDRIRQDYPEGGFEAMLLQRAVSFPFWSAQLRRRLLVEKVVAAELEGAVVLTPAEVEEGVRRLPPDAAQALAAAGDSSAERQRFLRRLRRQKAEEDYAAWFDNLRQHSAVHVDSQRWAEVVAP